MVVMSQDCTQNEQPVILPPDERLRLTTAERLAAQFARVEVFLDHCEALSRRSSHDPVAALAVAARLIRANADLASVLLRAARTETRHRTFSVKAEDELNPKIQPPSREERLREEEELRREIEFKLNKLIPPKQRAYDLTKPEDYPPWFGDDADDDEPESQ